MPHWLAVGSEFNVHSNPPYTLVNWNHRYNIKDHDAVFLDLEEIYSNSSGFHPPRYSTQQAIEFPDREAVAKHTRNHNDIYVRLPPETEVQIPTPDNGEENVNLLNWLPFDVRTDSTECGKKVSVPVSHFPSSRDRDRLRDWRWYFKPPLFDWDLRIMGLTSWPDETPDYKTQIARDLDSEISRHAKRSASPSQGNLKRIATTNADELIAAKLTFKARYRNPGSVYLLPSRQKPFSEFVVDILQHRYGYTPDNVRIGTAPRWIAEVNILGENKLSHRLSNLESEIADLEVEITKRHEYKGLLYENGDNLEGLVRDAFREFGFVVNGESPGRWDGIIQFDDRKYLLEVTGIGGGIKERKLSQLDRHTRDYQNEKDSSGEIYTLLVANTYRDLHPAERDLNEGNFIDIIQGTNKRVMTTLALYSLLNAYFEGTLSKSDVKQILYQRGPIVQHDEPGRIWTTSNESANLTDRVSQLWKNLRNQLL